MPTGREGWLKTEDKRCTIVMAERPRLSREKELMQSMSNRIYKIVRLSSLLSQFCFSPPPVVLLWNAGWRQFW